MQIGKRLADFIRLEDAGIGQANGFRTSALLASVLVGGVLLTVQDAQATGPCNQCGTLPAPANCDFAPHTCDPNQGHVNCIGSTHSDICC